MRWCPDGEMAIFGDFLRPEFLASRVQHVSDLHLNFALRIKGSLAACTAMEVWQTSNLRRLTLGEEKKIEDRKKAYGRNIMAYIIKQVSVVVSAVADERARRYITVNVL